MKKFAVCAIAFGLGLSLFPVMAEEAAAPAAAAAPAEESVTMTGTIERTDKAGGSHVYVFIEKETKARIVVPNSPKQLPEGASLDSFVGQEITLSAVLLIKERDGKVLKPIKKVTSIQPAAPAAATP